MARKKKPQQAVKAKEDEAYRPFSGINLKEHVVAVSSSPKPAKKQGKFAVGGYHKDADFGDILAAFEAGEDVSSVSKGDNRKSRVDDTRSFADIFAEWEESQGIAPKKQKPKHVEIKKSAPYKQTKDFGAILSQFEGKPLKSAAQPKPQVKTSTPSKPMKSSFVASSGKSFGDMLDQFEGKEKAPKQSPKPSPKPMKESFVTSSGKSFGELLDQFEGKPAPKKVVEQKPPVEEPKKPTEAELREAEEKAKAEERKAFHHQLTIDGVKWAGNGINVMMTEVAHQPFVQEKETKVETKLQPSTVVSSGKSFGELLAQFESSPVVDVKPVETETDSSPFANLYKAWSDEHDETKAIEQAKNDKQEFKRPSYTIGQLRAMLPLVTKDMHGFTAQEAAEETTRFLADSREHGLLKICIITGKGNHSPDGIPVVKEMVESVLHGSPHVREYASPKARFGGSGALWIILKEKEQ